jgi:hypothetical protein
MVALTAGMLVLLGISQVGYAANKYVSYSSPSGTPDAIGSDIGPTISNVIPNQIDFDQHKVLTVIGTNFGEPDRTPAPVNAILLDGHALPISIEPGSWTSSQIRADLPGSKAEAAKQGFGVPGMVDVSVRDSHNRASQPWPVQLT